MRAHLFASATAASLAPAVPSLASAVPLTLDGDIEIFDFTAGSGVGSFTFDLASGASCS